MNLFLSFIKKHLLAFFGGKPSVVGIHITDSAIYCVGGGLTPLSYSLRLSPGIIQEGKVIDEDRLVISLTELHRMVEHRNPDRHLLPVILVLPQAIVYAHSFSLPNLGEERFEEARALNLQMLSPVPAGEAYMSAEILATNTDRYDLLGAFAEKKHIDPYLRAASRAGILVLACEFQSLALARVIEQEITPSLLPFLLFHLSSDGLSVSILEQGKLYFDYFRSWRSIQGDQREISRVLFESVVTQEIQKVINFTLGRFKETPHTMYLIASGLEDDLTKFLESRFGMKVIPFVASHIPFSSSWYPACGAWIRGGRNPRYDTALTLHPSRLEDLFYEGHLFSFMRTWGAIAISLSVFFLVMYLGSALFVVGQFRNISDQVRGFSSPPQDEFRALQNQVHLFNAVTKTITEISAQSPSWSALTEGLRALARIQGIEINRFEVGGIGSPITLSLSAPVADYTLLVQFKDALTKDGRFQNVDLPVAQVATLEDNTIHFIVRFELMRQA